MKTRRALRLAALAGIAMALATLPAHAGTEQPGPPAAGASVDLQDPDGYLYDVGSGWVWKSLYMGTVIENGTYDAYDGGYSLEINGTPYDASTIVVSGRNILCSAERMGARTEEESKDKAKPAAKPAGGTTSPTH